MRRRQGEILELYSHYANATAERLGVDASPVWLVEPDLAQYASATQRGGGMQQSELVALFCRIGARIDQA